MALILALNPGNSHSPTLSRLARELHGCELIGAESCVVAIKAIKERVPDVLLLPAKQARGEADLLAHLKTIPGGVLTLKLPPVESADPVDLARQIREMLTGAPSPGPSPTFEEPEPEGVATSPHLLAAAAAAINWIRMRREQWTDVQPADLFPAPAAQWSAPSLDARKPYEPDEPDEPYKPYEPIDPVDADEPYAPVETEETDDTYASRAPRASYAPLIKTWLPRVAAVAAALVVLAALASYWPQLSGGVSSTVGQLNTPREAEPTETQAKPIVAPPAAKAEIDPLAKVSGWVAVFASLDVSISEGGRGLQVDERGRTMLTPGRHRLRFQNRALGYDETRTVDVRPADTTTINLIPETTLAVTSNEPAEVLVDGTRVGDTPYDGKIGLGNHTVTVKTAGAERQLTVEATSKPVQLEVDFSKP